MKSTSWDLSAHSSKIHRRFSRELIAMRAETEAQDLHNAKGLDEEDPLAEDMEDLEVSGGEEKVLHSRE